MNNLYVTRQRARRAPHAVEPRGFTLIETLVALVILSVGLLGVAKLVLGSVHADDSAYMRGQATQLAYEMLDLMRANRQGAFNGYYLLAPANNNCSAAVCTQQQLAELDLYNWQTRVAQALPAGLGTVATAQVLNDVSATITVTWDDSLAQSAFGAAGVAGVPMSVTLESVL
jgi:type IV pilus assembly protein PilV